MTKRISSTLRSGGNFVSIGGVAANRIAKWDGRNWSALGSGVSGYVRAIAFSGNDVLVGGVFNNAGGKRAQNFARWIGPPVLPPPPPVAIAKITAISINRKKLTVTGEKFDTGAVILINGEPQKTENDSRTPTTLLIAKKAGKRVKSGDRLQIQNSDGKLSPESIVNG